MEHVWEAEKVNLEQLWRSQPRLYSCLASIYLLITLLAIYYTACPLSETRVFKWCVHRWVCLRCRTKEGYSSALLQPVFPKTSIVLIKRFFLPLPVHKSIAFWFAQGVMFAFWLQHWGSLPRSALAVKETDIRHSLSLVVFFFFLTQMMSLLRQNVEDCWLKHRTVAVNQETKTREGKPCVCKIHACNLRTSQVIFKYSLERITQLSICESIHRCSAALQKIQDVFVLPLRNNVPGRETDDSNFMAVANHPVVLVHDLPKVMHPIQKTRYHTLDSWNKTQNGFIRPAKLESLMPKDGTRILLRVGNCEYKP